MKVKITKTVDINQVPNEARRMLDQIKNDFVYGMSDKFNQLVMHSLSTQADSFFETINLLDTFRKDLTILDESLQEVQNIMTGYKNAVIPPERNQEPEQEFDQEWLDTQQAEYERLMSRVDGADEVENEEG